MFNSIVDVFNILSLDSFLLSATHKGVAPHFVMVPHDTIAVEGTSVLLFCGANGHDRLNNAPTISWLKDGVTIDMS